MTAVLHAPRPRSRKSTTSQLVAALSKHGFDPSAYQPYEIQLPDGSSLTIARTPSGTATSGKPEAVPCLESFVCRRIDKRSWEVAFNSPLTTVPHSPGLRRYARLISAPFKFVDNVLLSQLGTDVLDNLRSLATANELADGEDDASTAKLQSSSRQEFADIEYLRNCYDKLNGLRKEQTEAEKDRDLVKAEKAAAQIHEIRELVGECFTNAGYIRTFSDGDHDKKASAAVQRSMQRARKDLIDTGLTDLANHLQAYVKAQGTGHIYHPANDAICWDVSMLPPKS